MKSYGEPLRKALEKRGYTPSRLAAEIGAARQTVSAWLNDKATMPVYRLVQVADLLGCTTDELLGRETPQDNFVSRVYMELNEQGRQSLEEQAQMHYMNPRFLPERSAGRVRA